MNAQTPVVLITGAVTGIGRATALAFAREGASVVVSGRRDEAGQALAAELRALGVRAEYLHADVRHESEVRSLVEHVVEHFGRLDVAVNNAGTEGQLGPITEQSTDNFAATFETNVLGTLLSLKHEMRVMLKQGSGAIAAMLDRFAGGNEDAKAGFLSMMPAKRAATPEEIAQTIVFLASDKARFLTGQNLAVDGGYTAQ